MYLFNIILIILISYIKFIHSLRESIMREIDKKIETRQDTFFC